MNRKRRTEVLVKSDLSFLKKLSALIIDKYEVKEIETPNNGLVMIKMRDSAKKNLFYLGEILVTECKVMIGKVIGLGILKGDYKEKSYHLAVIDAAYNASLEEINFLDEYIEAIESELKSQYTKDINNILKTKVDFNTLDEEVKA
ncbi:MAG: phosphonate C-P lyase system protein PhnG [Tissierellales bacterium]|jgi:alpha-D-ribose 1-methylphosphonate 5-triphosphate synthase subunit PhnG|nr:phosphonate C-P lyase system protein PhnG [Tissierellales bacterium]HCX04205.1 phosphonate C-P lyase system protein PhnG [Clostridiales bacterium]